MICDDCGVDFEMWMIDNEEWKKIVDNPNIYLCIECFKKRADKKKIRADMNKIKIYNEDNPFN